MKAKPKLPIVLICNQKMLIPTVMMSYQAIETLRFFFQSPKLDSEFINDLNFNV